MLPIIHPITKGEVMITTAQELFNAVWSHLANQGFNQALIIRKALSGEDISACQYRTPSGLACAIGGQIPDDKYESAFEGSSINEYFDEQDNSTARRIMEAAGIHTSLVKEARQLQEIHDQSPKPRDMQHKYVRWAKKNGVEVPK